VEPFDGVHSSQTLFFPLLNNPQILNTNN